MSKNTDATDHVYHLIKKSHEAEKSEDAMRFSQAAVNAANALRCINLPDADLKNS